MSMFPSIILYDKCRHHSVWISVGFRVFKLFFFSDLSVLVFFNWTWILCRNDKGQLLLGIRRQNRQQTIMPSSVLSSDSMHIGILAAASHAAATNSRFTIFYNPRCVFTSVFSIAVCAAINVDHHVQEEDL